MRLKHCFKCNFNETNDSFLLRKSSTNSAFEFLLKFKKIQFLKFGKFCNSISHPVQLSGVSGDRGHLKTVMGTANRSGHGGVRVLTVDSFTNQISPSVWMGMQRRPGTVRQVIIGGV